MQVAQNFRSVSHGAPVKNVDLKQLLAMLDCEQDPAHKFVVVSKFVGPTHVSTVYDVAGKQFFRCAHKTGLLSMWKELARKHGHLQLLKKTDTYTPATN